MNELLQKHGCSNVFTVPEGLRELMSDITREVLRAQPPNIFDFIANYLSALIITREHGVMAVKILDDLCDCRPSITEHLDAAGFSPTQASAIAAIIQEEIEQLQPEEGNEKVKETEILKKILQRYPIDEVMTAKVCQIARNAYRDYWYRKQLLAQSLKKVPEEPWEQAAEHTLEIYKRTNPSFNELNRATEKIQAAYKGYYVRRNLLMQRRKKPKPQVTLPGAPLDVAESREIDLGRVINIKVPQEDVSQMFDVDVRNKLGFPYDPKRMLTHVMDEDNNECACDPVAMAAHRTAPPTPHSSVDTHSAASHQDLPKSGPSLPRISFAPAPPTGVIFKPSSPGLVKKYSVAGTDEVTEDITGKSSNRMSVVTGDITGKSSNRMSVVPGDMTGKSSNRMSVVPGDMTGKSSNRMSVIPGDITGKSSNRMSEVPEDITVDTNEDDEGASTVSDATTIPDAMNATDEDISEEEG